MKAIAITACDRVNYLDEMFQGLRQNNLEGYKLFMNVEPKNQEVIDYCNSIDFIEKDIVVNDRVLGVRLNPYTLLKRAFDSGATQVVYLEDDLALSPDLMDMCNWYFRRFDKNKYLCFNLYNHESDETRPEDIVVGGQFSALGFALTKNQWDKYFDPAWFVHKSGWDFSFTDLIETGKAYNVLPALSRTHHIGRYGGVHYRTHMHDDMYMHNKWNQEHTDVKYKLVK